MRLPCRARPPPGQPGLLGRRNSLPARAAHVQAAPFPPPQAPFPRLDLGLLLGDARLTSARVATAHLTTACLAATHPTPARLTTTCFTPARFTPDRLAAIPLASVAARASGPPLPRPPGAHRLFAFLRTSVRAGRPYSPRRRRRVVNVRTRRRHQPQHRPPLGLRPAAGSPRTGHPTAGAPAGGTPTGNPVTTSTPTNAPLTTSTLAGDALTGGTPTSGPLVTGVPTGSPFGTGTLTGGAMLPAGPDTARGTPAVRVRTPARPLGAVLTSRTTRTSAISTRTPLRALGTLRAVPASAPGPILSPAVTDILTVRPGHARSATTAMSTGPRPTITRTPILTRVSTTITGTAGTGPPITDTGPGSLAFETGPINGIAAPAPLIALVAGPVPAGRVRDQHEPLDVVAGGICDCGRSHD